MPTEHACFSLMEMPSYLIPMPRLARAIDFRPATASMLALGACETRGQGEFTCHCVAVHIPHKIRLPWFLEGDACCISFSVTSAFH